MPRYSFRKAIQRLSIGVLSVVGLGLGCRGAIAQNVIIPDNTAGSIVIPVTADIDVIDGGVIIDSGLFHSFQEFNIAEGKGAYFFSPSADIASIFSRVTGDNASEIFGTIGTYGNSAPDLWLMNPNGILFGPNSRLDVGSSFVASTANAILVNGTIPFPASDVSENRNILTIDNSTLFFNELSDARIENQSQVDVDPPRLILSESRDFKGLQVPDGESLVLASPEIFLNGGGLNALNGNIELFALGDINLTNSSIVRASNISIFTDRISVQDGSQILAQFVDTRLPDESFIVAVDTAGRQSVSLQSFIELSELPSIEGGGNIRISALDYLSIGGSGSGGRVSSVSSGAIGYISNGGSLNIQSRNLYFRESGQVSTFYESPFEGTAENNGGGNAMLRAENILISGNFRVHTDGNFSINEESNSIPFEKLSDETTYIGTREISLYDNAIVEAGDVSIYGDRVNLHNQSQILASQGSPEDSGNIEIIAKQLNILDSSQLVSSANRTNSGGSILISSEDALNIIGDPAASQPSSVSAIASRPGGGGQVSIETGQLSVRNGSQITASINGGGTGGSIRIRAHDGVLVEGYSSNGTPSRISAEADLSGGEFGILRSIRTNNPLPQNILVKLDGEIIVFTSTPGLVSSVPRDGSERANEVNIDSSIIPNGNNDAFLVLTLIKEPVASQVLFFNPNVPSDGALLVGQSFRTDFGSSIQGGQVFSLEEVDSEYLVSLFLSTLESIGRISSEEEEEDTLSRFFSEKKLSILSDIASFKESFINGAGEFYIVESTGGEFRIQDNTYTDTSFLDTQPGDLFLVFAVRDGGRIDIETDEFILRNGAEISTEFLGAFEGSSSGSNLNITANSVSVERNATISSVSEAGRSGSISIRTSDFLLSDHSSLTTSATGNATGGNITVLVPNGIVRSIDSNILATAASAGGGNVTINARGIRLEGDSDIQTNVVSGAGNGGNIDLTANYIIAFDDSDILAFARDGRGGNVTLRTPSFFGESFTSASLGADPDTLDGNGRADINATGSVNGIVTVPDVSFLENSLTSLSDTLVAPDTLIANSCIARTENGQGSLVATGGGGLASAPNSELSVPLSTGTVQAISTPTAISDEGPLQDTDISIEEPTGIYQLADGRLVMGQACL